MNATLLRKLALTLAENKTNPKSKFAHLSPEAKQRVVNSSFKHNQTDDELFKAISENVSKHTMPKNPTHKVASVSQKDYEYDELIAPNQKLEAEADKILAANPEPDDFDTEDMFNIDRYDLEYTDNDELLQNLMIEQINNQKARDFDKRYRTEYAKWEQKQYQPTKGPVYHIRKKNYIPKERKGTITPINELIENANDPYAGGVDLPTDIGSGVTMDKYKQFLDYIRTIK